MPVNIALVVPTLNRADLLARLLLATKGLPAFTVVVQNGEQDVSEAKDRIVIRPGGNIGVAAAWNLGVGTSFASDPIGAVVVANDDVAFGVPTWTGFVEALDAASPVLAVSRLGFCLFGFNESAWDRVGPFDVGYGLAYYEDLDWLYRAKLAGVEVVAPACLELVHEESATRKADETLNARLLAGREENEKRYRAKWGGSPQAERFVRPWDERKPE